LYFLFNNTNIEDPTDIGNYYCYAEMANIQPYMFKMKNIIPGCFIYCYNEYEEHKTLGDKTSPIIHVDNVVLNFSLITIILSLLSLGFQTIKVIRTAFFFIMKKDTERAKHGMKYIFIGL